MNETRDILGSEAAATALRTLYSRYGYTHFRMSKFEEYDLYARNRSFLRGDSMITFTGPGGKLMALRPDVTLSIVKNTRLDAALEKVYYTENVYRTDKNSGEMSEILQLGLECIGEIDLYQTGEVILLALQSLSAIGKHYILDISHMGFLSSLLDEAGADGETREALIAAVRDKNAHGLREIAKAAGIDGGIIDRLITAATLYAPIAEGIATLRSIGKTAAQEEAIRELSAVYEMLKAAGETERVRLDLSTVNDMSYYNGIILNGFLEGIPDAVLAGGRYDNLLTKMGKSGGAIGFAVYVDLLERFDTVKEGYDADALLLYGSDTDAVTLMKTVKTLSEAGRTVRAQRSIPEGFSYRQLLTIKKGEVSVLETND